MMLYYVLYWYVYMYTIMYSGTEPLNNVTFGTMFIIERFPFFGWYKCVSTIGK